MEPWPQPPSELKRVNDPRPMDDPMFVPENPLQEIPEQAQLPEPSDMVQARASRRRQQRHARMGMQDDTEPQQAQERPQERTEGQDENRAAETLQSILDAIKEQTAAAEAVAEAVQAAAEQVITAITALQEAVENINTGMA